jgi:hypothetical protein
MTPGRGRVLKRLLRSLVLTAGLLSLAPGGLAMSAPWTELSSEGGGSDDHGNSAFWRISSAVEPLSGSPSPLCDAFRAWVFLSPSGASLDRGWPSSPVLFCYTYSVQNKGDTQSS